MISKKIFALLFTAAIFWLTGFREISNVNKQTEDKWSGTVTFHEKKFGRTLVRCDWWMIATLKNNIGTALDSSITKTVDGDSSFCATYDTTELELGIEEDKGEYGITVPVPGCYGYIINRFGERLDGYGLTDRTAIVINRQRLKANRNILSDTLRLIDSFPDGSRVITTYTWNLKKSK